MKFETLTTSKTPSLVIDNVPGDLRLTGWDNNEIKAKTNGKKLELVDKDGVFTLSCDNDLILSVPNAAQIKIYNIKNDASLRSLSGFLQIDSMGGDLALRNVGSVKLGEIKGDLVLRHSKGDFQVERTRGDASIRDIGGSMQLGNLGGDLHLRELQGNLKAQIGGDAVLFITPKEGAEYSFSAGSDILLRLPQDSDVELNLSASGNLDVNLPDFDKDQDLQHITLGSASAKMTLSAGGDLLVTTQSGEWDSLADFDIGLPFIGADLPGVPTDLADQISHKVEAATRKAMNQAGKAGRKAQKAERQARRAVRMVSHRFDSNNSAEPVSGDERLLILKMLQEKKITAEEAENLLSALE
ncbi:MAG: hypothetical protein ISR59_10535 [Anaerolineales bacterium]|uniref:YvlB/LiaX N-terminal domain-containing protein n=1 Tax=Candidatus Desulfolinea nitratireducens TaxID=2841698 RepID=A0A8J6THB7_9CHLR|nr:hypothetical protein [Candidatus Desulfolinea nitratireducens]MBL6961535.1 hypothetical protein [Anaerolineales bacterium]